MAVLADLNQTILTQQLAGGRICPDLAANRSQQLLQTGQADVHHRVLVPLEASVFVLLNCLPEMRIIQPFRCNKERLEFTML